MEWKEAKLWLHFTRESQTPPAWRSRDTGGNFNKSLWVLVMMLTSSPHGATNICTRCLPSDGIEHDLKLELDVLCSSLFCCCLSVPDMSAVSRVQKLTLVALRNRVVSYRGKSQYFDLKHRRLSRITKVVYVTNRTRDFLGMFPWWAEVNKWLICFDLCSHYRGS